MRMDTWIVLVCAFDFSVIFQYCTSGFSSGQGPGGLARKRAASWCHGCSDGGLSKTWRCRDRVRSSMCLSNIDVEYPGISTTLATSRRSLETRAREQGQARNGCSLVEGDWNLSRWDCFQRVFNIGGSLHVKGMQLPFLYIYILYIYIYFAIIYRIAWNYRKMYIYIYKYIYNRPQDDIEGQHRLPSFFGDNLNYTIR